MRRPWTYDLAGNEESMTDPESQTTTYAYDDAGRRFKTTWPDHTAMTSPGDAGYGITETVYDEAGRILRQIDQNGDTVTRLYDLAGRMTSRVYRTRANSPTGTIADTDTFTYDDVGRMLTALSGRYSNTVTLAYDEGGRKESESLTYAGQSYATLYTYDDAGRPETRTLPDGAVENLTFTATGRPDTVTVGMTTLVDFGYDDGGRETSRTFGNSLVMNKSYRLDNSLDTVGTSGVVSLDYDYDATGNVIEEDRTGLLSTLGYTADYDDADRLTDWIRDNSDTQTWDLSPVGNWDTTTINSVPETRTHGPAHELTARGMNPLTYDVKGNLTSDTTGKLLAWDFDNKLRSVDTDADTLADVEYAYDAIGRRIEQTNYTGMGEGRTSTSRVYVLSGQQVVAEYARSTAANAPLYRYTHSGLYIDDKVCRWQPGGESGTYHYYHHNRQFSTVAITDANGDPVECYAYTPYGTVLIADETGTPIGASAHDHRYLYTGRDWDAQSGLWYFRARYMDPVLGRFIGRDSLHYVDGGSTYVAYFVPNHVDESGGQMGDPDQIPIDDPTRPGRPGSDKFDLYVGSCAGGEEKIYKGCCCFRTVAQYYPSARTLSKYPGGVYLMAYVDTDMKKAYYGSYHHTWHFDKQKDSVPISKGPYNGTRIEDHPGYSSTDYESGLTPLCPFPFEPLSLNQQFEVCAIGIKADGSQDNLGCMQYSIQCNWTYALINAGTAIVGGDPVECTKCRKTCTSSSTGNNFQVSPKAPEHAPKHPDFPGWET